MPASRERAASSSKALAVSASTGKRTPVAQVADNERTWENDRLRATAGDAVRWYGGDPILLRAIEGGGLDVLIEDWRPLGAQWLPHEARAEGPFGITIRLHVTEANVSAASPAVTP